jgi:4-aminobutyrate--pyruvate transaminase
VEDEQGRRYLEGMAGLWCASLGFSEQRLVDAAERQMRTLPYYHSFSGKVPGPVTDLVQALDRWSPIPGARVLFANSGSESNDTAVKLVRYYNNARGRPLKKKIIGRVKGYHGVTVAAASLSGIPTMHTHFDLPMDGVVRVSCPHPYQFAQDGESPEAFAQRLARELEDTIVREGPETVAAFIAEPVQGAGGVIVPHESYWPQVRGILDKYGVLLISDEVVTGFGRIGSMCGARAWGVAPDIMAMAKGINSGYVPLGATLLNERVAAAWEKPGVPAALMHGYTYSGHPLACAAANANLDIVQAENLPARASEVGGYLLERLPELLRYPHVGDVRGKGLMAAVELVVDRQTKEMLMAGTPYVKTLIAAALQAGAIVRVQGNRMILSPPLVFSREDVDETLRILHLAFTEAEVG